METMLMLLLSRAQLIATLSTVACQAPLSMRFFRQEHLSGLPFPPPGDLPNPVTERASPALQVDCVTGEQLEKKKKKATYICLSLQKENTGEHSRKH